MIQKERSPLKMTVNQLMKELNLKLIAGNDGLDNKISGGYCG